MNVYARTVMVIMMSSALIAGTTAAEAAGVDAGAVARVQESLTALGMPTLAADGYVGDFTRNVLCAWREMHGHEPQRGDLTTHESAEIAAAHSLPIPSNDMVTGYNVNRACQIMYWVKATPYEPGRYFARVFRVSTGREGYPTDPGLRQITWARDVKHWNSTSYPSPNGYNMYRPIYIDGGEALHGTYEDAGVYPYPASHGCVRMSWADVDFLWSHGGTSPGIPVRVYGTWRG